MPALARNKSYCLNLCLVLFAGAVFLKADPPKPEPSRTKEQPAVEARATQTFRQVTYHEDNTVASVQLPSGDTTTFAYDPRKRPVGVTYADGSTSAFSYDDLNRLLSLTDPRQKVYRFAYDDNGNLQSLRDPADETATLAYDTDDRPASITDRLGSTGTLVYDARGLPLQVIDWVGGTTEFTYDEAGQLIAHARPNGTTTRYGYDGDGRLSQISEEGLAEAMSIRLQRDAAGRITSAEHDLPLQPELTPGAEDYAYDAAHQLEDATYDTLGRLVADGARRYTWNLAERLTSYTQADTVTANAYDALGMRISRSAGGVTQEHVWNYAHPLPSIAVVRQVVRHKVCKGRFKREAAEAPEW